MRRQRRHRGMQLAARMLGRAAWLWLALGPGWLAAAILGRSRMAMAMQSAGCTILRSGRPKLAARRVAAGSRCTCGTAVPYSRCSSYFTLASLRGSSALPGRAAHTLPRTSNAHPMPMHARRGFNHDAARVGRAYVKRMLNIRAEDRCVVMRVPSQQHTSACDTVFGECVDSAGPLDPFRAGSWRCSSCRGCWWAHGRRRVHPPHPYTLSTY